MSVELLRTVVQRTLGVDVTTLTEATTLQMIKAPSDDAVMQLRDAIEKEAGLKYSVEELLKIVDLRSFVNDTPTVASLQQEATGIISAVNATVVPAAEGAKVGTSYFVTGSTGFLGGWVVNQLAKRQEEKLSGAGAKLYLLVRKSEEEVRKSFADRGLNLPTNVPIVFLKGDNAKPNLGLTSEQIAEVQKECGFFYHCAAHVVFGCSYAESRPSTVLGAQNILKLFANAHTDAELHYVSTNGVYPPYYTATTNLPCKESQEDFDEYLPRLKEGYGWSKWVAERAVFEFCNNAANKRAVHIYRPGNIGWAAIDGRFNANDFQTLIYFACMALGKVPNQPTWNFEMTPVDALADHMLCAGASKEKANVDNVIGERKVMAFYMGAETAVVSMAEWLGEAKEMLAKVESAGLESQKSLANALEQTIASFEEYETLDMYLSDTNDYFSQNSFSYKPDTNYVAVLEKRQPK